MIMLGVWFFGLRTFEYILGVLVEDMCTDSVVQALLRTVVPCGDVLNCFYMSFKLVIKCIKL